MNTSVFWIRTSSVKEHLTPRLYYIAHFLNNNNNTHLSTSYPPFVLALTVQPDSLSPSLVQDLTGYSSQYFFVSNFLTELIKSTREEQHERHACDPTVSSTTLHSLRLFDARRRTTLYDFLFIGTDSPILQPFR